MGGGDGGVLREVARHLSIEEIHLAEIDECALPCLPMQWCKAMHPFHSHGLDKRGLAQRLHLPVHALHSKRLGLPPS